jgi:ribose 5-phosphate isomerase B
MCYDIRTVINSREHNNANVLSLGRATAQCRAAVRDGPGVAETRFGGGRHIVRVNKIMALEREASEG